MITTGHRRHDLPGFVYNRVKGFAKGINVCWFNFLKTKSKFSLVSWSKYMQFFYFHYCCRAFIPNRNSAFIPCRIEKVGKDKGRFDYCSCCGLRQKIIYYSSMKCNPRGKHPQYRSTHSSDIYKAKTVYKNRCTDQSLLGDF